MAITILDLARFRAGKDISNGQEFADVGLPIMGGCEVCGASIAAYNAAPSRTGNLRCVSEDDGGCIDNLGFDTVEAANLALFPEEYKWQGVAWKDDTEEE